MKRTKNLSAFGGSSANDAPPRPEKTAKIQRSTALEGRDVRLSAASFADFLLFFHSCERCPPFARAHAPDPVAYPVLKVQIRFSEVMHYFCEKLIHYFCERVMK
jgi:hypothetical protein